MRRVLLSLVPRLLRASVVVVVLLLSFSSVAVAETETETQGSNGTSTLNARAYIRFAMVSIPVSKQGYPNGSGSAELQAQGALVSVHFDAEGVASKAQLMLILLANSTAHSVVNMTTSYDGEVEAEGTVSLAVGSYSIGLQVLDTSSFSTSTIVLVSNPSTQPVSVAQVSQTSITNGQTQTATTVREGETEDGDINAAIQTRVIPAVVEVSNSGSSTTVTDSNFSVSIGKYQQNGYLVSIEASNVTGSRVLLVNLTSSQARSIFSGPVQISLDGTPIPQASALSEVLSAPSGSPAKFVLVSGPTALKVLVLIPHFSYHTIEIIPVLVQAGAVLLYYAPALLFSVAAVTVAMLAAYSRRTRVEV